MTAETPPASGGNGESGASWVGPAITAVTGVLAAATTTATALAALAGGGQRLLLNEPEWTIVAMVCFSAGLIVLFVASLVRTPDESATDRLNLRRRLMVVASVLIAAGALVLVYVVITVGSRPQQPSISATFRWHEQELILEGVATSSELDLDRRLWLAVQVFDSRPWPSALKQGVTLLIAQAGPGGGERVELPYTVHVPTGEYRWVLAKAWEGLADDLIGEACIDFVVDPETDTAKIITSTKTMSCVYQQLPSAAVPDEAAA